MARLLLTTCALLLVLAAEAGAQPDTVFIDRTAELGLTPANSAACWVDIDNDTEGARYVQEVNRGYRSVPTICFPDGTILVEPSDEALRSKLGL